MSRDKSTTLSRAQRTRGESAAVVVPIEDFNILQEAVDRYFAREADRDLARNPDACTYCMSEVVAAIFGEDSGQSVA